MMCKKANNSSKATTPHSGESTNHHDQFITSVNFKTTNTTNRGVVIDPPPFPITVA